jgi:hypothetical protein
MVAPTRCGIALQSGAVNQVRIGIQQMPCPEHGRRETEDDGPRRQGKNERAFCLGSLYPQDRMAPVLQY